MFSRDKALHADATKTPDVVRLIRTSFSDLIANCGLNAGFFCVWNEDRMDTELLIAEGIPEAPFTGTRHDAFVDLLKECLSRYPAAHVHSVSDTTLWEEMTAVADLSNWQRRALFVPVCVSDTDFILLCFAKEDAKLDVSAEIRDNVCEFVALADLLLSSSILRRRLRVMEIYVREIGHDIASSVQAIVAKLRNVSRGLLQGEAALERVRQSEEEIMSAYRTADTLGITVDPDYNLGTGDDFDARDAIRQSLTHCRSEAEERHLELRFDCPEEPVPLWGDDKGIQSAVTQLLMNAIKYARGSSHVTVRLAEKNGFVEFSITDRGKPLDADERAHMWEFGWRGDKAKELHVNGSGIGLYTVKKIVEAHGGTVGANTASRSTDIVTFFFRVPTRDILRKSMLL